MDTNKEINEFPGNLWDVVEAAQNAIIAKYPSETSIAQKLALKELESIASSEATDEQKMVTIRARYLSGPASTLSPEQEQCRIKAESGNPESQYRLGTYYFYGDGVQQNYLEAVKWFCKAAKQDYIPAVDHLGWCYCFGWGVPKDEKESFSWYKKALEMVYEDKKNEYEKEKKEHEDVSPLFLAMMGYSLPKPLDAKEMLENHRTLSLLYSKALNGSNVKAQIDLGFLYRNGEDGLPINLIQAEKLYRKAAAQNDAEAEYCLGWFIYKYGVPGEETEAIEWFQKAVDGGFRDAEDDLNAMLDAQKIRNKAETQKDANSLFELGDHLFRGDGFIENKTEAAQWYLKAVELGHVEAMFRLGQCYFDGDGIGKNEAEGLKWCHKAADNGNVDAMFYLGNYYFNGQYNSEDKAEGIKWFKKAAELGHQKSPRILGRIYSKGNSVDKNDVTAFYWFKMAAERGDSSAKYELAKCYWHGQGTVKNIKDAIVIWRELAERKRGSLEAQYKLGLCYYNGDGVEKDYDEAIKWFQMAAGYGKRVDAIKAKYRLGLCYYYGNGVNKDYSEAVKWFSEASEQGHVGAQFYLGTSYFCGNGVNKDYIEAVKWYRKAAEKGLAEAQFNLANCYCKGEGVPKDVTEAIEWYRKAADLGISEARKALERLEMETATIKNK